MARATYSSTTRNSWILFSYLTASAQLAGKKREMSPRHLAAFGVMYTPTTVFSAATIGLGTDIARRAGNAG